MIQKQFVVNSEQETIALATSFAHQLKAPLIVGLQGNIGVGKSFLTRAVLNTLGYNGRVKSPTFTIVEPYSLDNFDFYHFDFYRINDPDELDFLGIDDYFYSKSICFIEWPEMAIEKISAYDINCAITIENKKRKLQFSAVSDKGNNLISEWNHESTALG